ncbi:MAG: cation diffusion facilitator family transporter [Dehalococcoidia bacterium]|nr:cation diffusion facilitator family transporter [Dehalococcoidia bacterium]
MAESPHRQEAEHHDDSAHDDPSGRARADHEGHGHDEHEGHGHAEHEGHGHDEHEGHGHDEHEGHDEHGHAGHDHAHDLRGASRRSLIVALVLISTYMVAEVVGGVLSGSLALLADAGHMLTDAAAITMALVAMWIAQKEPSVERTFGYHRTEILAALANTFALWLIAGWIVWEAYHRAFREDVEVVGLPVLLVGIGGFVINVIAAWVLHRSSGESLNVEGAFQHVLADLLGSVGVIISAVLIIAFEWHIADPILSVVIAVLIVYNTRKLIVNILNVLLEGSPERIDVYKLCHDIEEMEGVTLIHDVHVWTITSGNEAFTAHVLLDPAYQGNLDGLIKGMQDLLHNEYGIGHATIQVERSVEGCTENHHVGHLLAYARSTG